MLCLWGLLALEGNDPISSLRNILVSSGTLEKIRCVAIEISTWCLKELMEMFADFKSLEMVFIVVESIPRTIWTFNGEIDALENLPGYDFRTTNPYYQVPLERIPYWTLSLEALTRDRTKGFREGLQTIMARGTQKLAPRIVLVEKAWNSVASKVKA